MALAAKRSCRRPYARRRAVSMVALEIVLSRMKYMDIVRRLTDKAPVPSMDKRDLYDYLLEEMGSLIFFPVWPNYLVERISDADQKLWPPTTAPWPFIPYAILKSQLPNGQRAQVPVLLWAASPDIKGALHQSHMALLDMAERAQMGILPTLTWVPPGENH